MSQYENPYGEAILEEPKTSGMAIASLVLSLIGIIPCLGLLTAPIGALLGLVGVATISGPARKGKGLAMSGLMIGVIVFAGQLYLTKRVYDFFYGFYQVVEAGPRDALAAGSSGDYTTFKAAFFGDGSTASDEEVRLFFDTLQERYGDFQSSRIDETAGGPMQPAPGQASLPFPYIVTFSNGEMNVDAEIVFADTTGSTQGFINKLGYILIYDSDLGDLRYPPLPGGAGDAAMDDAADDSSEPDESTSGG